MTLDGRYDAVMAGSRSLFVNLGGDVSSLSAGSRAAQWMFMEQAIREARLRTPPDNQAMLHAAGREAFAQYLSGGRVVFHVSRAADIRRAVAFAQRNGMKPVIVGGEEAWVVADELHLIHIATHPNARRHGAARALMSQLLSQAPEHKSRLVLLEVVLPGDPS